MFFIDDIFYYFFVNLLVGIVGLFFREISQRGSHEIPQDGSVIFVIAPHVNQFVDPLIFLRHCSRKVSFLIAKKSYDSQFVGSLSKFLGSIPVLRPQDYTTRCCGSIVIDGDQVRGCETKFTQEFKENDSLLINNVLFPIKSIVSDTLIVLKKKLEETMMTGTFKRCPHMDHSIMFEAVHEKLISNGCIAIFPEGGSHDRAEMLPLKAGVSIMALGSLAKNPTIDIKIVPCGLNYFHPHKFRSRAVVEFGKPITINRNLVERYKLGGNEKINACNELLNEIEDGLRSVTVNAPDYETLQLFQAVRRLYKPSNEDLDIKEKLDLTRKFAEAYLFC